MVKEKVPSCWLESSSLADRMMKTKQILDAINHVFYTELKFTGNAANYYDLNNSFIDKVVETKRGIPITLAVVYMSIARRLGLNVQGVNFPGHFLVRLTVQTLDGDHHKYIDCFDNGKVFDEAACVSTFLPNMSQQGINTNLFRLADKTKIFIRMCNNIANVLRQNTVLNTRNLDGLINCLELILLLSPDDDDSRLLLSRLYLHQGINLEEVVENLKRLFTSNRNLPSAVLDSLLAHATDRQAEKKNTTAKLRSSNKDVEFRVGMIMKHKRYDYLCVIYGWDNVCCMSESWKVQMGVYNLSLTDQQPYYNVLAHDGSSRYAAQESLARDLTGNTIDHSDIGKYFDGFHTTYYAANELLNENYPEDQPFS